VNRLLPALIATLCALAGCTTPLPRNAGEPPDKFHTDGCSGAPDLNFRACCETHDLAYWRGGSCRERLEADRQLRACIAAAGHPVLSEIYFLGVRAGGVPNLPTSWRWGFGWPYGFGYTESCSAPATAPPAAPESPPPP
jgi:hypothetical protein